MAQIGIIFKATQAIILVIYQFTTIESLSMSFAKNKAKAVIKNNKSRWVIGADTIVTLEVNFWKTNSC